MTTNIIYSALRFLMFHVMVWFSTNLQFIDASWTAKSFWITLALAIPTSFAAYYGSRFGYAALGESVWGVRFLAFAISYLTFPIMTYYFLGESMFTLKTMSCIFLSCVILFIQFFL